MVLEPIEVMDYRYEFKIWLKSYFYYKTKQLMQGFELMARQLRGKLAKGGSSSSHHGETHKNNSFEYFHVWVYEFRNNNSYVNSLRNNQQSTSIEETKEHTCYVGDEAKKTLHQED